LGVTIHYQGKLNPKRFPSFQSLIVKKCKDSTWGLDISSKKNRSSGFFSKLFNFEADRPLFVLDPHPDCEPLIFDFSYDWRMKGWVKTSFAPIEVHVEIVELLRKIESCFVDFRLVDEGEYAETNDLEVLEEHRMSIRQMIDALIAKGARGPIKLEDGRIVDCTGLER
jgi:hypothetical protein